MKKLSALLAMLFIAWYSYGQTYCSGYTSNTDWRNYVPPNGITPLPPYQNINDFDWSTHYFTVYKDVSGTITSHTIQSPFWANTSGLFTEPNVDAFREKFTNNGFYTDPTKAIGSVDIWPEDGWELLFKDFGTSIQGYSHNPCFTLYNRYTGIIRIFYYAEDIGNTVSQTSRVRFYNSGIKYNALLSFNETNIKALDAFTRQISSALGWGQALNNFWIYAEFPTAFDPCICRYPTDAEMSFKFALIKDGIISLEGNASGYSIPGIYDNGVFTPYKYDLKFDETKKIGVSDYLERVNNSYREVHEFTDNIGILIGYEEGKTYDLATVNVTKDAFEDWATFAEKIPYVGAVIGILDFFVGGGKAKNEETREVTPMSYHTDINLKLTGSITEDYPLNSISFETPGANYVPSLPNPVYNNPLGVFNLLETPPVEYAEYSTTNQSAVIERYFTGSTPQYALIPNLTGDNNAFFYDYTIREYKLLPSQQYNRLINFIVNPSSGLQAKTVKAALLFKFSNMPDYIDTSNYFKYAEGPVEFGISLNHHDGLGFIHRMRMLGYEIESWPIGSTKIKDITFRTNYVNVGCLADEARFFCWHNNNDIYLRTLDVPDVWLKLDCDFKRTDAYAIAHPTYVQDVLMVLKYDVKITPNATMGLTYSATLFTSNSSLNVATRLGYELLLNGDLQPYSLSWGAYPTLHWNGTRGNLRQHTMSISPWPTNLYKQYGTLIINSSNASFFVPPPVHPPGTTINTYNLYIDPSLTSFNLDVVINVGNNVYAANNWLSVNTIKDWQQNATVCYAFGGGQPIAYFGSGAEPINITGVSPYQIVVLDPVSGEALPSPLNFFPIIPGFDVVVNQTGTITMTPNPPTGGHIFIQGYNNCYESPADFQATQSEVQAFCSSTTYATLAVQKSDPSAGDATNPEEYIKGNNIKVFPNPNNGAFIVSFETGENENVALSIYDITGKQIVNVIENKTYSKGSHKENIVLDNIEAGVYITRFQIGDNIYQEKIVIIK